MDVAIVYESMFGNTRAIAEAIAAGVREGSPDIRVAVLPVAQARTGDVAGAGLLIVGGPTHMRGMTTGMTRRKGLAAQIQTAKDNGRELEPEPGAEGPGVRDWLEALPVARRGSVAAAFDTRAGFKLAGGAAKGIARRLRRHGYQIAAQPEGFIIEGTEGPLRKAEPSRARAWGAELASHAAPTAHPARG